MDLHLQPHRDVVSHVFLPVARGHATNSAVVTFILFLIVNWKTGLSIKHQ